MLFFPFLQKKKLVYLVFTVKLPSIQRNAIYIYFKRRMPEVCHSKKCFLYHIAFLSLFYFFKSINFIHTHMNIFIRALLLKSFQRCYLNLSTRIHSAVHLL